MPPLVNEDAAQNGKLYDGPRGSSSSQPGVLLSCQDVRPSVHHAGDGVFPVLRVSCQLPVFPPFRVFHPYRVFPLLPVFPVLRVFQVFRAFPAFRVSPLLRVFHPCRVFPALSEA